MRYRSLLNVGLIVALVVALVAGFALRQRIALAANLAWATVAIFGLPPLKDGDIIFQTSRSSQSVAIQQATRSVWSHMGMIVIRQGEPYVLEASATVRYTPLRRWVAYGVGGRFVVKRLADADKVLTSTALVRLDKVGAGFLGRRYDLTFEWSDDRMYCSELVWKIYDRAVKIDIGTLQQIKDFDLSAPAVVQIMKQRYGDAVPMAETVISPASMYDSPLLVQVAGY